MTERNVFTMSGIEFGNPADSGRETAGADLPDGAETAPITLPQLLDSLRVVGAADGRDAGRRWARQHIGHLSAAAAQRILTGIGEDPDYLASLPLSPLDEQIWPRSDRVGVMASPTRPGELNTHDWEQARQAFMSAYTTAVTAAVIAACRRIADAT
jgi:hypothetical protein